MPSRTSSVRRIVGASVADNIRFSNLVFAIVAGALIWFTPLNAYDWPGGVFIAVIIVALLVSWGFDLYERHRQGEKLFDRTQDLDRPGGPYDHLHGRK